MADDLTTPLVSGSIRFTGLGSGTDFDSMITKLIEAEKTRTKRLQSWRSGWETKSEEFDKLSLAMLDLNMSLASMNSLDKFLLKSVTSSNTLALTATATSAAEESTHEVRVVSLATNDMHMGAAIFSSTDAVIGVAGGQFVFTHGSRQISVDVNAGTTLAQFVGLINSDPDNRDSVRASLINDGSGYRLQIRGMDLGAGNDFIIDDTLTTVPGFFSTNFIQTRNAANAKLTINGWPDESALAPSADVLRTTTSAASSGELVVADSGASQFRFSYGGRLYTVPITGGTGGTTYADLAAGINAAVGAAVSGPTPFAQIDDSSGRVALILTGDPGSANQITIVDAPGTTVAGLQARNFSQERGATDGYIERPTNFVADIIPGLNLTLTKAGESTTLTTGIDSEAVLDKVRAFVADVNSVLALIQAQTKVTIVGDKVSGATLTGNYGVQMIQQRLKGILAQRGLGFDYDLDRVASLGSVGIITDATEGSTTFGQLLLDEEAFLTSLRRDPDAVARLFGASYSPSTKETVNGVAAESSNFKFESYVSGVTGAGDFAVRYTISGGAIALAPPPTINGQPANIDGNRLVAMGSDNPARGLTIEIMNLTDGNYAGQVQLKLGKAEELRLELKKLTDPLSGTLEILKDNYQDIMDAIDDKIAYEERRLTLLERTLRQRFAKLEALLGNYDNIATQLTSQISGLSGSK